MEKVTGYVTGVNGNLVSARFSGSVRKNEVGFVKIGNDRLKGEVIRISGDAVSMQIYEMTNGIQVGDEVERGVTYLPTGRLLPPDAMAKALNAGTFAPSSHTLSRNCFAARTGKIELRDTRRQIAVVYAVDRQFPFRLIYGQAGEYICLEPMTCMANCQNAPFERALAGFDCIPPGETKTYRSQIYLRDFYGKAL